MSDLILICEMCGFPITNDKGSLYIRLGDIVRRREAQREWDAVHPKGEAVNLADFKDYPDDIHWRTGHDACRADHDEGCYEIDEPKIRTWRGVARWTAHLMEKNWFGLSDWDGLLRELSGESPAKRIRVTAKEAA